MNQHNGATPYSCEECGKAFSKRIQLRQHRLSHGSNKYGSNKYACLSIKLFIICKLFTRRKN